MSSSTRQRERMTGMIFLLDDTEIGSVNAMPKTEYAWKATRSGTLVRAGAPDVVQIEYAELHACLCSGPRLLSIPQDACAGALALRRLWLTLIPPQRRRRL